MKSLDSINKSLEERFDPKLRTIGESEFEKYDNQKRKFTTSKFFHIKFSTSIPEETKIFLKKKLPGILDFPIKFGLEINHANHLILFKDQETYESEMGNPLPKNIILPASSIVKNKKLKTYEITIIIPKKLETAEVVVNITRNIFAKLYGKIFFNEQIIPLEFYKQSTQDKIQINPSIPEILDIVIGTNFQSKNLRLHCEKLAKNYSLNFLKQEAQIKKLLINEWREKWEIQSLTEIEKDTIFSIFKEFNYDFRSNPEKYYKYFKKQVMQLNSELHFILPHELRVYINFERKHFIHYIRSIKNKLEEINSLVGFIEELNNLMDQCSETQDLKMLGTQIRSRMKQMRKEKKVIHFYVPDVPKKSELKHTQKKFPLTLIKMLAPGTPLKEWSKEVSKLEKNYAESIYSKLYSILHCFSEWTLTQKEEKNKLFFSSFEGKNLKKLLPVIKFRANSIQILQNNLGLLLENIEQLKFQINKKNASQQLVPLKDFSKAWSYFISSILTLLYYKEHSELSSLPQGFRSDNFLKSIHKFVDKKCSLGINYFLIVKLLWLVYERKKDDSLEFIIYCIQNPQNILRYILHQLMLPDRENKKLKNRFEKISTFRDILITVYQNRIRESINS